MRSLDSYRLDFLDYLYDIRGYSNLTVKSYNETLQSSLSKVEVSYENELLSIDLMAYRLQIASLKPKTIARKLSTWRSFVQFIEQDGIEVSLLSADSIKTPKTLPKPINHSAILEALAKASIKERMIIVMLYTLGLRISELYALRLNDMTQEWVRVVGKGTKMRDIPLLDSTKVVLDEFISIYKPAVYLCSIANKRLSENSLRYMLNLAFKRVGLRATPHQLRHSYATELLQHDARISDVSELLGHSSMATTQIYTKLSSSMKLKNYQKAHPLCMDDDA